VIAEYIDDGVKHIHIAGEPGIGKTTTLHQVTTDLRDDYAVTIRNIWPNHSLTDIFREVNHTLFDHLPNELIEDGWRLTGVSIGPVGGSWDSDEPDAARAQFGHRDALRELTEHFPEDQPLLICVDDIHELADDDRAIRGAIEEIADILPPNVRLVTAGRLAFHDLDTAISLDTFTEDQTARLLRNAFPDIDDDRIQAIHDQVDGHPLYLGLLIESNDGESLALPDHEVYNEIEERYLRFLSSDERRLLRATAPLQELNEAVCTHVLPDNYDLDRVAVVDILESLSTRTVVQTIGRTHDGLKIFKVHDVFRDVLHDRWDRTEETEQRAFRYYAETTIALTDDDQPLETEVSYITSCREFLTIPVIQAEADTLATLVEQVVVADGFSFYPASLLVTALKTRDTAQLPDQVVDAVVASVDTREEIANDFYDEQLHSSWAEHQFEQGAFETPSDVLLSYLGRITDTHPAFVRQVIEETTTDDERTRRYLIRLGTELPADDTAAIGEQAVQWIQEAEAYHDLAGQALELVTHLCAHSKFDTALHLLDAVLTPLQPGGENQLQGDQGMTRYRIIQTLDEIFDTLLTERGTAFIDLLQTNLEAALRIEDDDTVDHEVIVRHTAVSDLDYADENRGTLPELLLEYFTRATMQWVSADPADGGRQELMDELLDGPIMFRRVSFALLAAHPDAYPDTVEATLRDTDNYRDLPIGYEFYRLLDAGFPYLDPTAQEHVCEIISDGPYTAYEQRAEQLAEREGEPASYFEQRIEETWQRDRFFLIRNELPDPYADRLTNLLDKYGDPDRLPTESHRSAVTGGFVNQRGPEQTEELSDQPAETVLTRAVEWEPPETEGWETDDSGQLEERNHLGFSRQLRDLIKEQPDRYAREISILEDANPRYAEAAFRAFRELLDDGQTFPWHSIIELGTAITDEPTVWSSGCRTNLAKLLNKGIATEETAFPQNHADEVREILLTFLDDPDPDQERDQPADNMAGSA
jgi:hypothetical protein